MANSGTTTVNFGSFPGSAGPVTAVITGQAGILSGSLVGAWIYPVATADHTADEHVVDPPMVVAGNIVAGTGFTIYATSPGYPNPPDQYNINQDVNNLGGGGLIAQQQLNVSATPMPYGLWTVAWCWN